MSFSNAVDACSQDFSKSIGCINTYIDELKTEWQGDASEKFFSETTVIKSLFDTIKKQFSLMASAAANVDEIEKINEEIMDKKDLRTRYSELASIYNDDPTYLNQVSTIEADIASLEEKKTKYVKLVKDDFDSIVSSKLDKSGCGANGNYSFAILASSITNQKNKSKAVEENRKPQYKVGEVVANTSTYNNDASGCVWYVRGRMKEKLGVDTGRVGNANQMCIQCIDEAKLAPTKENIKPNILVCMGKGTSSVGQYAGHVLFVEDVVGDTVYYTECAYRGPNNTTILAGTVKQTTKDKIINGTGGFGTDVVGFVDCEKYLVS